MNLSISPKALPRNLGILGVSLPFVLWLGDGHLAPSISHYYYTDFGIYFTGVLFAFGLFLYTYKGYEPENEKISDNWLTNIAGLFAIGTALVPTSFFPDDSQLTFGGPNAHTNSTLGLIHLLFAGAFLTIMGYMAYFKFTLSGKTKNKYYARRYYLYKISGVIVWLCIAFLAVEFTLEAWLNIEPLSAHDVFFAELVALVFFGTAWLIKSQVKPLKYVGLVEEEE